MKPKLVIYWSRRDFRLQDNPALTQAIQKSKTTSTQFLPLFILENYMIDGDPKFQFGYPSQYFLSQALPKFASKFTNFEIVKGLSGKVFGELVLDYEVEVFVNEDVHPDFYKQIIKLQTKGITVNVLNDQLTIPKETVSGTGNFYSVFSPFKKCIWQKFLDYPEVAISDPLTLDSKLLLTQWEPSGLVKDVETESLLKLFEQKRSIKFADNILNLENIIPKPELNDWYWSEDEALEIFDVYLGSGLLSQYKQNRDSLELDTKCETIDSVTISGKTSKMSLALAWGLVSSRTLKNKILSHFQQDFSNFHSTTPDQGALCFLSELIWREFYKYIFYHRPQVIDTEFQEKYRGTIKWVDHELALVRFEAWIKGQTGYPAVDAAMNQLSQTGWMHNRARMMVASILTKNLGVDWRWGQEYFRAVLIDLDEASNNGGWQWGSSTGSDPKPIRIFNPYLQAENYDKSGAYQKKWLPGDYWPDPLVEHKDARSSAMKRYGLNERGAARDF